MNKRIIPILLFTSLFTLTNCGKGSGDHANFNKAEEFAINEDSVEDLKTKLNECSKETMLALDNFSASITGKDININEQKSSESRNYETGEVEESSSSSFQFKNLNFKLEGGSKGIYSAEEAKDFTAYAEIKEISGLVKFSSKEDEKEITGAYKLDSNTLELYHYDNKEYIHMSAGFKTTLFGVIKKFADEEDAVSIAAAEAMIPKNGKICFGGLFDKAKYPLSEKPGDDYKSNLFDFVNIDDLLKLQNTALENGYELKDLFSFKVTSDKSHYLAMKVEINEQGLKNIKDLAAKTTEEDISLPLDVDVDTTSFKNMAVVAEFDAQKRLSYLSLKVENLNVDDQDEDEYYSSSTIVTDSSAHLEVNMDYSVDPLKKIPSAKELEQYTEYDLSSLSGGSKE